MQTGRQRPIDCRMLSDSSVRVVPDSPLLFNLSLTAEMNNANPAVMVRKLRRGPLVRVAQNTQA